MRVLRLTGRMLSIIKASILKDRDALLPAPDHVVEIEKKVNSVADLISQRLTSSLRKESVESLTMEKLETLLNQAITASTVRKLRTLVADVVEFRRTIAARLAVFLRVPPTDEQIRQPILLHPSTGSFGFDAGQAA